MKKQWKPLWTVLLVFGLLLVWNIIRGMTTADLARRADIESKTTPTAAPTAFNMLRVTPDPSAPTAEPVLKNGSRGDEVKAVQQRLKELGYYSAEIDGAFGAGTKAAVVAFQQNNALPADGVVGSETKALLFSDAAKPAPTESPAARSLWTGWIAAASAEGADEAAALNDTEETLSIVDELPLLVNRDHPLPEDYVPSGLINLYEYADRKILRVKGKEMQADQTAADALIEMVKAARADGVKGWQVSAAYRSIAYQQKLFDRRVRSQVSNGRSKAKAIASVSKTVQTPGCSEHHTGLAFDITVKGKAFRGTRQHKWLQKHAADYGFIIRYTKEKTEITGISDEPWHIRYVGVRHAQAMVRDSLCLEEYIERETAAREGQP